jgi:hypothetical protein
MSTLDELIRDPVFQLNSVLWLVQPLPGGAGVTPVLREAGFEVHAVAPPLAPPPDVLLRLKDSGLAHQDRVLPDIVLRQARNRRFALIECKGRSFGRDSTNASQARTLIVIAGPRLHESLGLQPSDVGEGAAAFLVPEADAPLMRTTLAELSDELTQANLQCGSALAVGLAPETDALVLTADEPARRFFDLPSGREPFMQLEPNTDPRPLYFIPYDPDCKQSDDERAFCKRVLFERLHAAVLGAAGRAVPPVTLTFQVEALLNEATLGMYDLWENPESNRHMRRLVRELLGRLGKLINAECSDALREVQGKGWELRLPDDAIQVTILGVLARFSCETMDLRREPEPGLFD